MPNPLFVPLQLGPYTLAHRVVMAPLTRMRAVLASNAPRPLNAEYYAQRATAGGFIIAEASQITPGGRGAPGTPGIHSAEQITGWKAITDAVVVDEDQAKKVLFGQSSATAAKGSSSVQQI